MGVRATYGKIDKNGNVHCTSVQWSSFVDRNFGQFLKQQLDNGADLVETTKDAFSKITENAHILYFENYEAMVDPGYEIPCQMISDDYAVFGNEKYDDERNKDNVRTAAELAEMNWTAERYIENFHSQDGISMFYDENDPQFITFFYWDRDNPYNNFFEKISLVDLANGVETTKYKR